jgi:hypothetical protein
MSKKAHARSLMPRIKSLTAALSFALVGGSAGLLAPHADAAAGSAGRTDSSQQKLHNLPAQSSARGSSLHHPESGRLRNAVSNVLQNLPHSSTAATRAPGTRVVSSMVDSGSGSLREALSDAVDGDIIDLSHLHGRIALSSALVPNAAVTIRGPGRDALILDGGGNDRVIASAHSLKLSNVTVANGSPRNGPALGGCLFIYGNVYLSNTTITGCKVGGTTSAYAYGGALLTLGGLEMKYSTVSNSSATSTGAKSQSQGGGILNVAREPNTTSLGIYYSTISGNSVTAQYYAVGGGVVSKYKGTVTGNYSQTLIAGTTISGNTATASYYLNPTNSDITYGSSRGGGVAFANSTTGAIVFSTVTGNSAVVNASGTTRGPQGTASGGGVYSAASGPAYLLLAGTEISDNAATSAVSGAFGGGVTSEFNKLVITTCSLSNNTATGSGYFTYTVGGGAFSLHPITLTNSTVSGNTANGINGTGLGGGVATYSVDVVANPYLTVQSSTVSGNKATGTFSGSGGGLYVGGVAGITADNSTIAFNSADTTGAGIAFEFGSDSTQTLVSTIVANNIATADAAASDLGQLGPTPLTISGSNNLVMLSGDGISPPGDTLTGDPGLAPLAFNGGPTKTHALATNSIALDVGLNPLNLTTDQRGGNFARVIGTAADIGAYELNTDRIFTDGFERPLH